MAILEASKDSIGKLRYSLLPLKAIAAIIGAFEYGAKKYDDFNYMKGTEWSKYYDALQRHITAFWGGENFDEESRLYHLAHAGCCVLILLTYQILGIGSDDRLKIMDERKDDDKK